jgi:release factor glutamine methyltransferase
VRVRDILRGERDVEKIDVLSLLSSVLSLPVEKILTGSEQELQPGEEKHIHLLLSQRRQGKPIAYLTGKKEFFSLNFLVDSRVLIPRPETEILVEEALRVLRGVPDTVCPIVDVGTGSGAIGITLARETGLRVTCLDISPGALRVAKTNATRLGVADRVDFVCSDLFSGLGQGARFELIVANLPYVSADEWSTLMPDVRFFEPKLALWGGKDGIEIYSRLISEAGKYISSEGHILCEIGGREQAELVSGLLHDAGFSVKTRTDLSGRDRVVVGSCRSLS